MCLFECRLQLFELLLGKYGPMSTLPLGRRAREHGRGTMMMMMMVMATGGSMSRNSHGHHVTRIDALVTGRGNYTTETISKVITG